MNALAVAGRPTALLDALTTSVVVLAADGRVRFLNAAAEGLLGVSASHATGRALAELLRGTEPLADALSRVAQTGQSIAMRELMLSPAGRADHQLLADCTVSPLADGEVLLELVDQTLSSRRARDAKLLSQVGGSRLMVKSLAHEIKNPLGGLRGAAQLLARELPNDTLREYTGVIIREADRLVALVDRLLGPGAAPRRVALNLHEPIEHVLSLLQTDAAPGIVIERDYDPSLPPLAVDRDQLIQAILNLGRNAVQAVGREGRLCVRTRVLSNVTIGSKAHRVVASIALEDDGPGVPVELKDSLFYPLVTGRPDGTGLGLAVAQELITRHGGLIEFESRAGCTVFTVLLPYGDQPHE
jgi:two-component system, NtrC family, nitrogen regulation sensor histidine kinase GlnL